jgi:pimeloyl-ACP methyl ester carboxylesterase
MAPLGHFELGTPSGVPLVFLHGFPSAAHQVLATPDLSVFARFRLIAFDRPGFGDSAPSPDDADISVRFESLVRDLGIDTFHLLSVSGGTRTAFELADKMRDRKGRPHKTAAHMAPEGCGEPFEWVLSCRLGSGECLR